MNCGQVIAAQSVLESTYSKRLPSCTPKNVKTVLEVSNGTLLFPPAKLPSKAAVSPGQAARGARFKIVQNPKIIHRGGNIIDWDFRFGVGGGGRAIRTGLHRISGSGGNAILGGPPLQIVRSHGPQHWAIVLSLGYFQI
jgi:hypothetical protein